MFRFLDKFKSPKENPKIDISISQPMNIVHSIHATLSPDGTYIEGLPEEWYRIKKCRNSDKSISTGSSNKSSSSISHTSSLDFEASNLMKNQFDDIMTSVEGKKSSDNAPSLPEKMSKLTESKTKKKPSPYQNVNIKSIMDSASCEATVLKEIQKFCHHDDLEAYENYEVTEKFEGISSKFNSVFII